MVDYYIPELPELCNAMAPQEGVEITQTFTTDGLSFARIGVGRQHGSGDSGRLGRQIQLDLLQQELKILGRLGMSQCPAESSAGF